MNENRHAHYAHLKQAIISGRLRLFAGITSYVPVTALAFDLKMDCMEVEECLAQTDLLTMRVVRRLAFLMGMDAVELALWITNSGSNLQPI